MAHSKSNGASSNAATPYRWATVDRVIIVTYAVFFVIACFVDYINAFHPASPISPSSTSAWHWPPSFMWPLYYWWCRAADPVLCLNPLWIKYLSLLSPVLFAPFYLVSIYAIAGAKPWIRIPSVIYASVLFVDLSAFLVEAVWGELPSPNIPLFMLGYGYYQAFPLLLLWRFWADDPFKGKVKSA